MMTSAFEVPLIRDFYIGLAFPRISRFSSPISPKFLSIKNTSSTCPLFFFECSRISKLKYKIQNKFLHSSIERWSSSIDFRVYCIIQDLRVETRCISFVEQ